MKNSISFNQNHPTRNRRNTQTRAGKAAFLRSENLPIDRRSSPGHRTHTHTPIETNPKVGDGEVLNDCRRTAAEPVRRRPQLRVHTITKDGQASQTGGHQQGTRTIRQSEKIRKTPSNIRGRSQCCPAVMDASKTPVVSQSTMPR